MTENERLADGIIDQWCERYDSLHDDEGEESDGARFMRGLIASALDEAEKRGRATYKYCSDMILKAGLPSIYTPVTEPDDGNGDTRLAAPPGHILDDAGQVRKYDLGNDCEDKPLPLPVFADGALWMLNEYVYIIERGEVFEVYPSRGHIAWTSDGWVVPIGDGENRLLECYSTREAAEAARGGQ